MKAQYSKRARDGTVLVTVMILAFLIPLAAAIIMSVATQQARMSRRVSDRIQAKVISQAGANKIYSVLASDWSQTTNCALFALTQYGNGSYESCLTMVSSNQAVICSTGHYRTASARTMMDVKTYGGAYTNPLAAAYACAILSGGLMTWTGSGSINVGSAKVHTNNKYKMTGSQVLNGNVSSCVEIWSTGSTVINGNANAPAWNGNSPGNVTGTATTGPVPLIAIPDIDLTPYYNIALANNQVYNSNQHWSGSTNIVIPGGIAWINGTFKYSGSGTITGCIIATGKVTWTGSGGQVKVGSYPAVVSRDGEIDISGSGPFHGLIYAPHGNFDKSGSGDVVGSVICAGTFDKSGSWSTLAYEYSEPSYPGQPAQAQSNVVAGLEAWQE